MTAEQEAIREFEARFFVEALDELIDATPKTRRDGVVARAQVEGDPVRVRLLDDMHARIEAGRRRVTAISGRQAGLFGGGR